jgi:hypothetical protein
MFKIKNAIRRGVQSILAGKGLSVRSIARTIRKDPSKSSVGAYLIGE